MFFFKKLFFVIKTNKLALISLILLSFFSLVAVLAPHIVPYSFSKVHPTALNLPPVWLEGGKSLFLLGTDDLGRDFLSRLIYGAYISMSLSLLVVLLSVVVGTVVGLLAGYYGGYLDRMVVSVVDIMMSFPSILLAIVVVAILGPGLLNTVMAVTIMTWPGMIRIVRAETLKEKNRDYVEALKSFGAPTFRLVFKHILPNASAPLIAQAVLGFSEAILNIAALGFLGLGAEPPLPEWGTMIRDGRDLMADSWWLVVFPGLCILFVVLCFNILGGILRDTLDPKVGSRLLREK